MRITGLPPSTPIQPEGPFTPEREEPGVAPTSGVSGKVHGEQKEHVRHKRGLFTNLFRRQPSVPARAPSVASPARPPVAPPSPMPPARAPRDSLREISAIITGRPGAGVLPSQSHVAPKTLAEVTQNLVVADRLHKAGVFSTEPKLGTVARDAFVNAGINGLVSVPMSIATYAGSTWTGEAIKGQYAAQTPLLPPIHQPPPSVQTSAPAAPGVVPTYAFAQSEGVDTRLRLAELRIEVVANNIMAVRQGTGASALKISESSADATDERLNTLEALYDVAEKQLKLIGDENDMIFRPYSASSATVVDADPRRLDRLDKRFEVVNKFLGKLIVLKNTELPAETATGSATA